MCVIACEGCGACVVRVRCVCGACVVRVWYMCDCVSVVCVRGACVVVCVWLRVCGCV